MRRGVVVAAAALSLLATGCGGSTEGTPQPSSEAAVALWDPCTEVGGAELATLKLDPGTKETGVAGVEEPGWKVCSWNNTDYSLGVFSTRRTIQEFRDKPDNVDFRDITIAGRPAVQHGTASDDRNEVCSVLFPVGQGTVQFLVLNSAGSRNGADPCARATQAATVLAARIPS